MWTLTSRAQHSRAGLRIASDLTDAEWERVFADSAYAGERVARATCITPETIRRPKGQVGFAVQPRRWVWRGPSPG